MQKIVFDNFEYPIREIYLPKFGNVTISTLSLVDKLLDDRSIYVSDKARLIDEEIFYYVDPEEIKLPTKKILKIILSNLL